MTTYERAGDVRYGSFALDEPTEAERSGGGSPTTDGGVPGELDA